MSSSGIITYRDDIKIPIGNSIRVNLIFMGSETVVRPDKAYCRKCLNDIENYLNFDWKMK